MNRLLNMHIDQTNVVIDVSVRAHFGVSDHHAHPTGLQVCCSMAFGQVVPRGIGRQQHVGAADRGQVRFVDVTLHSRYAILEQVGDEGLAVCCAPIERPPPG